MIVTNRSRNNAVSAHPQKMAKIAAVLQETVVATSDSAARILI